MQVQRHKLNFQTPDSKQAPIIPTEFFFIKIGQSKLEIRKLGFKEVKYAWGTKLVESRVDKNQTPLFSL